MRYITPPSEEQKLIQSFGDKDLEKCWVDGKCASVRGDLRERVLRKLDLMHAAVCVEDLNNPPSNHLHSLHGELEGYWAIRVSGAWRLIFTIDQEGGFFLGDVELIQYH